MPSGTAPRELDRRVNDGLDVRLVWHPLSNRLVVEVYDDIARQMFELDVAPECARDAFLHPYAYAPVDVVLKASERDTVWIKPGLGRRCARAAGTRTQGRAA